MVKWRSMFPRPRYHNPGWLSHEDRSGVYMVERALARLLEAERCRDERQDMSWHRPRPWRSGWSSQPRRFHGPPPRGPFQRGLPQGRWLPSHNRVPRRGSVWQRQPPRQVPSDWRFRVLPRRGPPVAAIRVPRGYLQEERKKREPRGFQPRGPLLEGPERSADDPQRNHRGGLCGGPKGQPRNHRHYPRLVMGSPTGKCGETKGER